ncbi:hypothetical protein [Pseudomonas sp. KUIN-1]|uniref:hypothetical protein n=1 Tax=Pseudomonas sp. KUIN-1 TaxID=2609418 RepID=UPI001260E352|nr:hypothetical protein [Pseudomonas sp. KUIN-1]BBN65819.1 hypothetical protein KUIN1_50090 [Pseudomonas sp. KUIN-1]
MSTGLLEQRANYPHTGYEYGYGSVGNSDADGDGRKEIDCSHLLTKMLTDAGYTIPYKTTRELASDTTHYDFIALNDVQEGDIALWTTKGHTGVVEKMDVTRTKGEFFGSQTSTGPKSAKFGAGAYWPMPDKYLRPKAQYRSGAQPADAPAPAPAGPAPLMNFQFPFRKADGKQFTDAEEVYKALEGETSGHYLLGSNKFWHGGIHISDRSAPQCVLNEPVRCMADGEVVAYRLNEDYLESTFGDNEKKLKYSNSFCLVRHEYKSAPNPEEGANKGKQNKLSFYSLYMHLLPFARYPLSPAETPKPKVTMKVGDFRAYDTAPAPGVTTASCGQLAIGTKLEISETAENGELTYAKGKILSGSVKQGATKKRVEGAEVWFAYLKNGEPYKNSVPKRIWLADDVPERARPNYWQGKVKASVVNKLPLYDDPASPTNGQPAGARKGTLELVMNSVIEFNSSEVVNLALDGKLHRMAKCTMLSGGLRGHGAVPPSFWACVENDPANKVLKWDSVTPTSFDTVVMTSTGVKAGDPIGYLGQTENLTGENGGVSSKYQVHVEIFTADAEVKEFLKNTAGLKIGKQYLHLASGAVLKQKAPATGTTALKQDHAVDLAKATVVKEGVDDWYEVSVIEDDQPVAGLIKKTTASVITQHDWEKLGFQIVEENNAAADGFLDPDAMPQFFKDLFAKIDKNHDGEVEPAELAEALKKPETRTQWARLVAHHPTEWKDKADSVKWSKLDKLLETSPKTLKHEKERIDKYVFWEELIGKALISTDAVWHFHPIELVRNFLTQSAYIDVERFVALYSEKHSTFQAESPAFSEKSKKNLTEIVTNINIYVDKERVLLTRYELAYMFATARHEAYNFIAREFFSSAPEIGRVAYFNKYDPVLADTATRRNTAIKMENTVEGDGYKYRGRGLVHLTWKKNYREAAEYFGVDFVSSPELAAEFKHSIPIMIWGMKEGVFSGAKIGTYIRNGLTDYEGARRVINGSDKKQLIASYALKFEEILKATSVAPEVN